MEAEMDIRIGNIGENYVTKRFDVNFSRTVILVG
jgi:hypothetical protein